MNKKRGVSSVIATVLIILITIAAVTVVWQFVIPMIKNNLEGADSCLNAIPEVSISESYTIYNTTHVRISVEMRDNSKMEKIILRITNDIGDSFTKIIEKENIPDSGARKTYIYDFTSEESWTEGTIISKIGVSPIVLKGNKEEICSFHEITPLNEEDLEIS